jgi:hypothetical protein
MAVDLGKHDFMGEQRSPFDGGGAVGAGAADELMLAAGQTEQGGLAESADNCVRVKPGAKRGAPGEDTGSERSEPGGRRTNGSGGVRIHASSIYTGAWTNAVQGAGRREKLKCYQAETDEERTDVGRRMFSKTIRI